MKRRLALLALPLILAALMLGAKWRADHPTVTKEDLKVRALMSQFSKARFAYMKPFVAGSDAAGADMFGVFLPKKELRPLIDNFYLLPNAKPSIQLKPTAHKQLILTFYRNAPPGSKYSGIYVHIDIDTKQGTVKVKHEAERSLHPATVKQWIAFLLNHPKIGPELQKRMK